MCSNNSSQQLTTINDLPDDLLCEVFDRLSVKQVLAIRTVNKDFNRCVKTWFKSVDELIIYQCVFRVQKSFGKPTVKLAKCNCDWFLFKKTAFSSLDKMLTVCTGIEIVTLICYEKIPEPELVEMLFNRCPNIKHFTLALGNVINFGSFWTRLIPLIKYCDVHLVMFRLWHKEIVFTELKQVFDTETRIKSLGFNLISDPFINKISILNRDLLTKIKAIPFNSLPSTNKKQFSDLIARHVDCLKINSGDLKELKQSVSCFIKLSHLKIKSPNWLPNSGFFTKTNTAPGSLPQRLMIPELKRLKIVEKSEHLIDSFFTEVGQLYQLQQLKLSSDDLNTNDFHLKKMMRKAPNITEVRLEWLRFKPTNIADSVKLVQFMSKSWARLTFVEIKFQLINFTANDFSMMTNLIAFVVDGMETKYKLIFGPILELGKFGGPTVPLPKNVEIEWNLKKV